MMPGLQELIHKLEEGEGAKYIRLAFFLLVLLGLTALWHLREAKNYGTIEAMDAGQLARNIADGRGYSTDFVRPLSIALIRQHRGTEESLLKTPHPDIANAPVYPVILAGLMKVLPMQWQINSATFWRYQPEIWIGCFNQLLFFLALYQVYRLASRLFDRAVGFLALLLMALTEIFWEFTTSGLSTMLLIVLFLAMVELLLAVDRWLREGTRGKSWVVGGAAAAGLLIGIMALTRYSMGWLIIPAAVFLAVYSATVRTPATIACVAGFVLVLAPWLARNYAMSGHLFGTAGFAIHEGASSLPGHTLARSMPRSVALQINQVDMQQYVKKLFVNGREIVDQHLPQAAGNWIAALFLGALLVPYRNPSIGRVKLFVVMTVLVLLIVQAMGKTAYSDHAPRINSENLLVIVTPLFFIFGCAFFFTLLDQLELAFPWLRTLIVSTLVLVLSLPLIFRLLPPRTLPGNYPPYWPPIIQEAAGWMGKEEMMITDMPWAVAWYGQRQAVWLPLDVGKKQEDAFYQINDEHKAIKGIYLTPLTTDIRFLSDMRQSAEGVWGKFYLDAVVLKNLPTGFPLKVANPNWLPDQLFITDRIRWRE